MKCQSASLHAVVFLFSSILSCVVSTQPHENFLRCLQSNSSNSISNVVYTPTHSSFSPLLLSSIQNLRFASPSTPKPSFIITPLHDSHIQSAILCSKLHGFQVRVRCGGHDYEGLSYISPLPFVLIDMKNYRSIHVDTNASTALVQGGASLGEVYYNIAGKSRNLCFPAGLCPTVGVGGHLSGGGVGTLIRKHGLAADNILDARIVNANGQILDRHSMGEDLFWAIRGGGAANFGVVLEWKIQLHNVPSTVTVFNVTRTQKDQVTKLVRKWQYVTHKLDPDLFIRVVLESTKSKETGNRTIQASFQSLFLGQADDLLQQMNQSFPELELTKQDCREMTWIESALFCSELPSRSNVTNLLRKIPNPQRYYKAKSDYVKKPIPESGLQGLWEWFHAEEAKDGQIIFHPFGGKMDEISEDSIPYPHRGGNLYEIQHLVYWDQAENEGSERFFDWIRGVYDYITPYVSKSPRAQYYNYRDLDLGVNDIEGNTSYAEASAWGVKYFKNNFYRLAQVKSMADPGNFFRDAQSIPLLY